MKQTKSPATINPLNLKWSKFLDVTPVFALSAIEEILLVATRERSRQAMGGTLFALQLDTGQLLWHYQIADGDISGLCLADYSGTQDRNEPAIVISVRNENLLAGGCRLLALDTGGAALWTHEMRSAQQLSAPIWLPGEQLVAVVADREIVYRFDGQDGKIINKFSLSQNAALAPPAVTNSQMIIPYRASRLEAFDRIGKRLWQYNHDNPKVWFNQTPTILNDQVFALTTHRELVSLQLQTGDLI